MAKKTAKKAPAAKKAKISTSSKPRTKGQLYATIAEQTELSRKQVAGVFECLASVMSADLGKNGPGVLNVAGLMKVTRVHKPATKAHERPDPFNPGKMMMVKAKPARSIVKVRALKSLKDLV